MGEVYNSIVQGLTEAIAYAEGNLDAKKIGRTVTPVRESYSAEEIKDIRNGLGMTQRMFAGILGVSPKTVESWERGRYNPDGAARRLISILQIDPEFPNRYNILTK